MISWLRNNHLILITTLAFLVSAGALLYSIDRVLYHAKKREIIVIERLNALEPARDEMVYSLASACLAAGGIQREAEGMKKQIFGGYIQKVLNEQAANLRRFGFDSAELDALLLQSRTKPVDQITTVPLILLRTVARKIITDADTTCFKMSVKDNKTEQIVFSLTEAELPESEHAYPVLKMKKFNTFKNCLFIRAYEFRITKFIDLKQGAEIFISGQLMLDFTTPPGNPRIEALTTKYRIITLGIAGVLGIFYFYLIWFLMLPAKHVISRIEEIKSRRPRILRTPRSLLERRYNDLVRDALLADVNRRMSELLSRGSPANRAEIYNGLDDCIQGCLLLEQVAFIEVVIGETGGLQSFGQMFPEPSKLDFLEANQLAHAAVQELIKQLQKGARLEHKHSALLAHQRNGAHPLLAGLITADEETGRLELLLARPPRGASREVLQWLLDTFEQLAKHLRAGIETLELQKNMIVWEKRQANISLSRNLGHDLTNIIATSKIDLTTLKKFQEVPIEQSKNPERRLQLVGQALEHLINNTRYLQEIVNIYRSFSYIKHPKFEELDVNQQLEDIAQVFRMSSSRSLQLKTSLDKKAPVCFIEPRLFKLAIFNLLTNSVEAIKRQDDPKEMETIELQTRYLKKDGKIEIRVSDSGPGICDGDGRRLPSARIDQIFELGASTKKGDETGEGLGLNWVKTIIVEFHKGDIRAANLENAGAEFIILIPVNLSPLDPAAAAMSAAGV